jgi:hypothetical protein
MKCPRCKYEWKLPGPQAGGRAKVKKGFAMGQPSAAARKRAWKTRKARAKRSPNCMVSLPAERIGFADSPPARGRKRGQETEGRRE